MTAVTTGNGAGMRWVVLVLVVLLTVLATSSCAIRVREGAPADLAEPGFDEEALEESAPGEQLRVPLEVVEGPAGGRLAFVPVFIHGEGPFAFALDTGATHSVVDRQVAEQLELEEVGEPQEVGGVGGQASAVLVGVDEWRLGEVDLPGGVLAKLDLSGATEQAAIRGLLGSDVLGSFGVIRIDYDNHVLVLRPGGAPSPATTEE